MDRFTKHLCAALKARLEGGKAAFPDGAGLLVTSFYALSRQRSYNSHGPNPISWGDLLAWSSLTRTPVDPEHARIIMALDAVWIDHAYQRSNQAPAGKPTLPVVSQRPITAALLDALLGA